MIARVRGHLLVDVPLAALAIASAPAVGWLAPAAAAACAAAMHAWGVADPRSSLYMPVWWRLPRGCKELALTFDDGPNPEVTPRLLDALARQGLSATFFLIGAHVARHPELARRIRAAGHAIGLHSHSHSRWFNCWGPARLAADLADCQAAISDATGEPPPTLFRPPVGLKNPMVGATSLRMGLCAVTWSARGRDTTTADPARIIARLAPALRPRAIVLLHDGHEPGRAGDRSACVAVVEALGGRLRACGIAACARRAVGLRLSAEAPRATPTPTPATALTATATTA